MLYTLEKGKEKEMLSIAFRRREHRKKMRKWFYLLNSNITLIDIVFTIIVNFVLRRSFILITIMNIVNMIIIMSIIY